MTEGVPVLALSGHNGFSTGPHLHSKVSRADRPGQFQALEFAFNDGNGNPVTPVAGQTFTRI